MMMSAPDPAPRHGLPVVTVVDYGMGNLQSVARKLRRVGAAAEVTSDASKVATASRLILPGVGHFGRAMANLAAAGLIDALERAVKHGGAPLLGICLGMQLLARGSEEGDVAGLGWIDADVIRFRVRDTLRYKVPHMGWNGVRLTGSAPLVRGVGPDTAFYFAHSYHLVCRAPEDVLCETEYEYPFPSVVGRGRVYGAQFHPEKSHDAGESFLRDFLAC